MDKKKKVLLITIITSGILSPLASAFALIAWIAVALTDMATYNPIAQKGYDMIGWGLSTMILPAIMLVAIILARKLLPKLWIAVVINIFLFLMASPILAGTIYFGSKYFTM